jgi:hypothetical protein
VEDEEGLAELVEAGEEVMNDWGFAGLCAKDPESVAEDFLLQGFDPKH